ncbi:MAG: hypothetical protein CR972_02390 [Candidatus Moraniibacteriota bacterium]|nr:MAG: hypothetical protein CR972_02390 [Candidatus Moranbacteria bacterium]
MKEQREVLFNSENAYRVATTLMALVEIGLKEALIPDIATKANISQTATRYWIDTFESCKFISTTRYKHRKNAIRNNFPHIIVHMDKKEKISYLYNYMWLQEWEKRFCADIIPPKSVKAS